MAQLTWDSIGSRIYETGLDRGVLYLTNGTGVAWNGLISVAEESQSNGTMPLYYDGVKYFDQPSPYEFSGTINAYTYPVEFLQYDGYAYAADGMFFNNQNRSTFSISYRTAIGNDTQNLKYGYKIHIIYDMTTDPSQVSYATTNDGAEPIEFSWKVNSRPQIVDGFAPVSHVILDSRLMSSGTLMTIENILYGTNSTLPRVPPASELYSIVQSGTGVIIIDNGNGTWTAIGTDSLFTMLDSTTFQITSVNATYIDADTYQISTTT
jgi:hypothetical protein